MRAMIPDAPRGVQSRGPPRRRGPDRSDRARDSARPRVRFAC